jgi:starch synthase
MRVLFLAAEATPLAKVGGLADVIGELPRALSSEGLEVRVAIPLHSTISRAALDLVPLPAFTVARRGGAVKAEVFELQHAGIHFWLIDGDPVRSAPGIYGVPALDASKFVFCSLAALQACEATGWLPDLIHAHDWHAAPAVSRLKQLRADDGPWKEVASLLTIHNLPYQGSASEAALEAFGLPAGDHPALPEWAQRLPLAVGIADADWVSTVSPTYALEIQTVRFGAGLEQLLSARKDRLTGILNGIDHAIWNPGRDEAISSQYDSASLEKRVENTAHLRAEFGLPDLPQVPLLGMVTRLDFQKGVDLAVKALELLSSPAWQFILLGTGDPAIEEMCAEFASRHGERVRFINQFDPGLSRRIYAGCDLLLIPSRYEPCGLAQMIGMRYGALPLVRSTGGLRDTVQDIDLTADGVGFVFEEEVPGTLAERIRRALQLFTERDVWQAAQVRAMDRDHSWNASALKYLELYRRAGKPLGS